jgi:uncharacterized protein (DUF1697 family)
MTRYIALFRAMNVGGNNRLPMKVLVRLLEGMGLSNVKTYIQSGNAVFDSDLKDAPALGKSISAAISKAHGFAPRLLVLKSAELAKAIRSNPFPEAESESATLHVTFLSATPKHPDLQALTAVKTTGERFLLKGRLFYLYAPDGIGRSKLAARIEKALGVTGTARNWRTLRKLEELAR